MEIKPGTRFRSAVCEVEVIVVKGSGDQDLRCGGHPLRAMNEPASKGVGPETGFDRGTQIGKRYTDPAGEVELLCTKAGASSLSIGDVVLALKDAKPLPSSD